jgi:hypothetical protein
VAVFHSFAHVIFSVCTGKSVIIEYSVKVLLAHEVSKYGTDTLSLFVSLYPLYKDSLYVFFLCVPHSQSPCPPSSPTPLHSLLLITSLFAAFVRHDLLLNGTITRYYSYFSINPKQFVSPQVQSVPFFPFSLVQL